MGTFRLHIDLQIDANETDALRISQDILNFCFDNHQARELLEKNNIKTVNYRLGHDDDRQKSNYFIKSPSGHVANKKCRIVVISDQNAVDTEEV
jgi:hypothetical protein